MADQPSQEEILAQQKANCIFCKIIAGEIESKKVYEDNDFIGLLDIKPAAPGHVLLLPKEHVPILQILPHEKIVAFYKTAAELAGIIKEAMIAEKMTIFLAGGYAAGQQSPHVMLHIIPREKGDGLDALEVPEMNVPQSDALALASTFEQVTREAAAHLGRAGIFASKDAGQEQDPPVAPAPHPPTPAPESGSASGQPESATAAPGPPAIPADTRDSAPAPAMEEFDDSNEALQVLLSTNDQLRKLIISQPEYVEDQIRNSDKLKKLFEGVDIHALSRALRQQSEGSAQKAKDMTEDELFAFIDKNEGLRTWLLENPAELEAGLGGNPRLQAFFEDIDLPSLAIRYQAHRKEEEG